MLHTRVASPMKKMACFPPTPKYEISLFKDLGRSATLQRENKQKNKLKKKHKNIILELILLVP